MAELTDFTNTSDVSDAAIEWALRAGNPANFTVPETREEASAGYAAARSRILAARLIQQHRPELLVDPVDVIVREELAKACECAGYETSALCYREGRNDRVASFVGAKRLYQMGLEAGKAS